MIPVQYTIVIADFKNVFICLCFSLVADCVLFNSNFNMESFLSSVTSFFKLMPDYRPKGVADVIRPKCSVLYFPMLYHNIGQCQADNSSHLSVTETVPKVNVHPEDSCGNPEEYKSGQAGSGCKPEVKAYQAGSDDPGCKAHQVDCGEDPGLKFHQAGSDDPECKAHQVDCGQDPELKFHQAGSGDPECKAHQVDCNQDPGLKFHQAGGGRGPERKTSYQVGCGYGSELNHDQTGCCHDPYQVDCGHDPEVQTFKEGCGCGSELKAHQAGCGHDPHQVACVHDPGLKFHQAGSGHDPELEVHGAGVSDQDRPAKQTSSPVQQERSDQDSVVQSLYLGLQADRKSDCIHIVWPHRW